MEYFPLLCDSFWLGQQPVAVIIMVTFEVPFPCFVNYFYSSSIVLTNTVAPNMNVKSHNSIESSKHIHFSGCQYIDQFKLNMESLNKQLCCVIIMWTASFVFQINDKNMSIIVLFFPFPFSFPSSFSTWAVMTQGPFLSTQGKQPNWFPSSEVILYPKLLNLKKKPPHV